MIDLDKAHGLMEGIAIGNLLGIVFEGWPKSAIAAQFPDGVHDMPADTGYPDDDDLAQAIIVAEEARNGPISVEDLGLRLWNWAELNGLGIGGLTHQALTNFGGDEPQQLARNGLTGEARAPAGDSITEASRQAWSGHRAGNGALMRCAPLALRWEGDQSALVRESMVSAIPTHWDPRCAWSCAIANLATAAALRGESRSPEALLGSAEQGDANTIKYLQPYGFDTTVPASVVEAVITASTADFAEIEWDGYDRGFTLLTLQAVLICFWRADDFASALSELIACGGDTDTNGAAAGAMLGAKFGHSAIPCEWLERASEIRAGRESLVQLADSLVDASREDRQAPARTLSANGHPDEGASEGKQCAK